MNFFWKQKALKRCQSGELNEYVCQYLMLNIKEPLDYKASINSQRFVVFDTEATGLNFKKDKLISIGAIVLKQEMIWIEDSFEMLVRQPETGDKESIPVHGILKRDLELASQEEGALLCFLNYIKNSVLVAHHADFDCNLLNYTLRYYFGIQLLNSVLDTQHFARRLDEGPFRDPYHKPGEYSLDALCEKHKIELHDRHTSAGDAFLTAELLQTLLYHAKSKGFEKLGDILK